MYNPLSKLFKNNSLLIVLIFVVNICIYLVDKNFGHPKTCYTIAAIFNIFIGVKLTINSYMNMNNYNTAKKLSK